MDNQDLDRISYALGLSMGNNFRNSGIKTINVSDFADGVAAVFEGAKPKMSYDEAKEENVTPSGLQYEVLEEGTGKLPSAGDNVTVHYTGKLIDGTVFDSSVDRGAPATFGVTQVIPGWVEALQMMKEGAKWRLFIPSNLAYGPNGAGNIIGPNSTLIFDVELIKVN